MTKKKARFAVESNDYLDKIKASKFMRASFILDMHRLREHGYKVAVCKHVNTA